MLSVVATVSAMLIYETIRTETYSSYAQLYSAGEAPSDSVSGFFNEESANYFGTQIELLKSPRIQGPAMEKAGILEGLATKKMDEEEINNLVKLDVTQPMKTSVLMLKATGRNPVQVQRFLDALIEELMAFKKERRVTTSDEALMLMSEQLAKSEKSLAAEQEKWVEFQRTNYTAVLEEDAKSAGLYLSELRLQLAKLNLDRQVLQRCADGTVVSNKAPEALSRITTNAAIAAGDMALKQAKADLEVLQGELTEKSKIFSEHNPAIVRLSEEVGRYQRLVHVLQDQNTAQQQMDLADLNTRASAIEAAIPVWEHKVLEVNERLSQSLRLKYNVTREMTSAERIFSILQNADLKRNVQQERMSVVQAPTPGQLTKRHLIIRVIVSLLTGIAMSLGFLFCWYLADDRFVSVRDIKDQFGETVLALIPKIRVSKANPANILLEEGDARPSYAEAYRHLRSALLLSSDLENQTRSIVVAGTTHGEGASSVALNLSIALARSGRKVVLVDADLQEGGLHGLLQQPKTPGLSDWLSGAIDNCSIIRATSIPGLSFVSKGSHCEDSEGLFLRLELRALVGILREGRDFVIFNSAAILASGDAALLVPHVDQVILVTSPYHTRSRQFREALGMLYQRQAKQIGIIFNRAGSEDMESQYSTKARAGARKDATV